MKIRNTRELIAPDKFKLKILVYGLPGSGKTLFASSAPNPGIAAVETGQGSGLLTIADRGLDFCEPESVKDLQEFCEGKVFPHKETLVLDSLTDMSNSIVKDHALSIPRNNGSSAKRQAGVPELDDYGVMGELTRRLVRKLLDCDKHVIVIATERIQLPDPENGLVEATIGPNLPGMMFLGSPAMFDFVLRLRTRSKLRDRNDAKSRYTERYFTTDADGRGTIAKCRSVFSGRPLLDPEEVFDPNKELGTFPYLFNKIIKGYEVEGSVKGI